MPDLDVPANLRDGVGRTAEGAAWLLTLPGLVARSAQRWGLDLGPPFESGASGWTAPGRDGDDRDIVLKIAFPHDEARDEAVALRAWHGHGVPLLLADHAEDWALLLERVLPGTPLAGEPDAQLVAAAHLARVLHGARVEAEVPSMGVVCAAWADKLEQRALRVEVDRGLARAAANLLRTLPGEVPGVVVHGDLNPGNVLRASGGWVAIDPKPMRGDPAYDPWPLLEQVDDPFVQPDRVLARRVALVADELGLDPARVTAWGLARATEAGLWRWAALGDEAGGRDWLERARVWARLSTSE